MTAPDLDALEKLADEATPGPWRHYSHGLPEFRNVEHLVESESPGVNEGDGLICVTNAPNNRDAAFIAAANPATIKALIAELKAGKAAVEELLYAHTDKSIAMGQAFLARNRKGEG